MRGYQTNAVIDVVIIYVGQSGLAIHDVRRIDQH